MKYGFVLFAFTWLLSGPVTGQTVVNRFMGKDVKHQDLSPAIKALTPGFERTYATPVYMISAIPTRDHNGILYAGTRIDRPDSAGFIHTGYKKKRSYFVSEKNVSIPDSLAAQGLNLCGTSDKKAPNTLFLFSRNGVLKRSILNVNNLSTWSDFAVVNGYRGDGIASVFPNRHGELVAFFSDRESEKDKNGKSLIYKIKSSDNGLSWTFPEIAVKHNLYDLTYVSVARCDKKGKAGLYMITADTEHASVFLSVSRDEGETWSYPILLPGFLAGSEHQIAIYDDTVYILYEDNIKQIDDKFINNSYGSLLIWKGSVKDLTGRNKGDGVFRLVEPGRSETSPGAGPQAVIVPLSKDRINLTLCGKWIRPEEHVSIKSYDIRIDDK